MLLIQQDNHGRPHTDFITMRNARRAAGERVTPDQLAQVSYAQLHLAAIATAGPDRLPLQVVRAEKQDRRRRFLNLPEDEFLACERYLRAEGMFNDLCVARHRELAPSWGDLDPAQKLWAKLHCLFNHLDQPTARIDEVSELLKNPDMQNYLPAQFISDLQHRMRSLAAKGKRMNIRQLRNFFADISYEVMAMLSPKQRKPADQFLINEFSCTSDCFRVVTGGNLA